MTQRTATIQLPAIGALVKQAARPLAESLVPVGVFWVLFTQIGFSAGVLGALGWSAVVIGIRLASRRPIPMVLVITTTLMIARTVLGLWTGSAFLYFLQPTIQNFLFAGLLVAAVAADRPLLARLADDFCAFPAALTGHPQIKRCLRRISLLWAFVFLANGIITLVVLATLSVNDFLAVSTAGSYSMVALGIGVSLWSLRRALARHGIRIRMGAPVAA